MSRRSWVLLLVCLLALAPSTWAQTEEGEEGIQLSLAQVLKMALENNLDLVSAQYTPQIREQDIETQQSTFDVGFQTSLNHREQEQSATQRSGLTGFESDNLNAGIQQTLKFGTTYTVGWNLNKFVQTGFDVQSPTSYTSGVSLGITVPVLKGAGTQTNTESLVLARNSHEISLRDLEGEAERIIETVEGAYWDVVATREALRVARLALKRAQDLLDLNTKKVEVGTLAPIEITQAKAGVASEEEGVIVAETALRDAEDELRRLLAIPPSDPRWDMPILATDRPQLDTAPIAVQAAIDLALEERPEIHNARQTVHNRELSERVAKREKSHQLDFNANYTPRGSSLDMDPLIIDDIVIIDEFNRAEADEAISNIFEFDEFDWNVQLTYTVAIGNRQAKANYVRASLARQQSEVDLENQEQLIRVEVRRSARAVESGAKRVEASRKNVELQAEKLEAEQKKFDNGMSTSFEVLTFQNDLADAELSLIRAGLDYAKAQVALERSKGTLLESRGLTLAVD